MIITHVIISWVIITHSRYYDVGDKHPRYDNVSDYSRYSLAPENNASDHSRYILAPENNVSDHSRYNNVSE